MYQKSKEIGFLSPNSLDLKDRKLLLELFSTEKKFKTDISKKLLISKEMLSYRLKRLKSEGILQNISPIIDYAKLGYHIYRLQLQYHSTTKEQKEEVMTYLKEISELSWLVELAGSWDIAIGFKIKDTERFEEIYTQIITKYGGIIKNKLFTIVSSIEHLSPNYIQPGDRQRILTGKNYDKIELEENAKKIIIELNKDGQLTLSELAKRLKVSITTIRYHLEFLESKKIIVGYKPIINATKLGFEHFKIVLELADTSKKNLAKEILGQNNNVIYITESLGKYDLEFEAEFEKVDDVLRLIEELKEKIDLTNSEIIFSNKEVLVKEIL